MRTERAGHVDVLVELASVAGVVANVCDHAEHNEPYDDRAVERSAERLRSLATAVADAHGRSPLDLYRDRLRAIEQRNVVHHEHAFDGPSAVDDAATWRELQLLQVTHDRYYHADVVGLAKNEQLRHYALHVAKLAGAAAEVVEGRASIEDFLARRVPDMLLFGLKLATVTGQRLPDALVCPPARAAGIDARLD